MSEFSGSTLYTSEIEQPPTPEAPYSYEQAADAVNTVSEISESHPDIDIDVKQFSAGALIKACPHYAKMAEINPELARAQATEVVQRMQERETMQEKGVDATTIKRAQFAAMKERLQAKAKEKAASKTTPQEPDQPPAQEKRIENAEAASQSVENKPQLAPKTEIAAEPKEVTSQTVDKGLQSISNTKVISENSEPYVEPQPAASDVKVSSQVNTPQSKPEFVPRPVKAKKVEDVIPTHEPLVVERVDVHVTETIPMEPAVEQPDMEIESISLNSTELPFSPEEDVIAQVAHEKARVDELDEMTLDTVSTPLDYYESDHELKAAAEVEHTAAIETPWQKTTLAKESSFDELESSVEIADTPSEQPEVYGLVSGLTHTSKVPESTDGAVRPEIELPQTRTSAEVPEMYASVETVEPERTAWGEVLKQEPIKIYDGFSKALQAVIATPEKVITFAETTDLNEPVILAEAIQELTPPPVIATAVVEQLATLEFEEKEAIAPLLQKILKTTRTFTELSTAGTEPKIFESTQAEVRELIITLFNKLNVTYESEDIEHFIAILLQPDFQPSELEEPMLVDLQDKGTHEAKLPWAQFVDSGLADIQETGKRLLGKLVLLSTTHRTVPEYELAA
jgi:uncharacterized protein YktA (UPF0223 family)